MPEPRRILEIDAINSLIGTGTIVVCAGGGGIPVVNNAEGGLRGIKAVVDRDLTAAILAHLRGTVVNKATRELTYHLPGEA